MKHSNVKGSALQQWQAFRVVNLGKILGGTGDKEKGTKPRPNTGGPVEIPEPNGSSEV